MRINPEKKSTQDDGLDPIQRKTRNLALVIAFLSVFLFFFKILFL